MNLLSLEGAGLYAASFRLSFQIMPTQEEEEEEEEEDGAKVIWTPTYRGQNTLLFDLREERKKKKKSFFKVIIFSSTHVAFPH